MRKWCSNWVLSLFQNRWKMSKLFGILILLFPITISAQKFVNTENLWYIKQYNFWGFQNSIIYRFSTEDVIINDTTYKRLERSYSIIEPNWEGIDIFFREDSSGYVYRKIGDAEEILLYDFNEGIEPTALLQECQLEYARVDTILLENGTSTRAFIYKKIDHEYEVSIIDGIGTSITTPLIPEGVCWVDGLVYMSCFSRSGEVLYESIYGDPCYEIRSVTKEEEDKKLKLTPNNIAAGNPISIESKERVQVQIFSTNGQLLKEMDCQGYQEFTLDRRGMFIYRIVDTGRQLLDAGKIIVH